MATQSPTEQTISTRCRRLRQLIDMYFRALEWVIHCDNGWELGKAENRFCLNRQNLKALGINTVADINDDPDWTQSVENVMWDKKSVDETGLFYRSDLQSKAESGGLEPLPYNAVVTMITFNPNPNHIPIWEILVTMKGAFCRIEKDIQITRVQWSEPPSFRYCECAKDLLDYVKAKNQQPEEILKNLETERKKYKQLANTVRRRSAQLSNKTHKQAGAEQEIAKNIFRNDGDRWTVVFNNSEPCYINDIKGMRQIAQLLTKPHKTISAVELANPQNNTVSSDSGEPQEKVDGEALIDCRKRLNEIPVELAEAEKNHDLAKTKRLQSEKDHILAYVKTSTRPSGKSGSFNNKVEKARKTVSNSINRAIDNIKQHNPTLCQHLDNSIQQGIQFAYSPDTKINWEL